MKKLLKYVIVDIIQNKIVLIYTAIIARDIIECF